MSEFMETELEKGLTPQVPPQVTPHYPWVSVSSAQSVFKPQRAQRTQREVSILCALCVLCGRLIISTANDFGKTTHYKGRKERKALQQEFVLVLC
jgi:hypothetical protein